jgi:integrase
MRRNSKTADIPQVNTPKRICSFPKHNSSHTYASLILMRGAKPQYVQQQLGHETLSTTLRYYAHWIPKEVKESYAKLIDVRAGEYPQVEREFPILTPDSASKGNERQKAKPINSLE